MLSLTLHEYKSPWNTTRNTVVTRSSLHWSGIFGIKQSSDFIPFVTDLDTSRVKLSKSGKWYSSKRRHHKITLGMIKLGKFRHFSTEYFFSLFSFL